MKSAQQAPWRMLALGFTVWAPFGTHGWRPAIIISLGKNRGANTVVHLSFETSARKSGSSKGRRIAGELYWRKPELKGGDKPSQKPCVVAA